MSIDYYNNRVETYIERTSNLDLQSLYDLFEPYLTKGIKLLDLGCGSGRDSLYFSKHYHVTSVDGSIEMVKHCQKILTNPVIHATFESFQPAKYHAIWACASLLHIPRKDLTRLVQKYIDALYEKGVFFMSFKKYDQDFTYEGRSFTCFDDDSIHEFIHSLKDIQVELIKTTQGIQQENPWIACVLRKTT